MTKRTKPFGRRPNSTKSKALQPTLPSPGENECARPTIPNPVSVTLTNKDMARDTGVVGMWLDTKNLELLHPRAERLVEDSGADTKPWWTTL